MSLNELDAAQPELINTSSEAGMLQSLQGEIRSYYGAIRQFSQRDISEVLLALAAFNARACEIRDVLVNNEGRRSAAFRTKQLDPFLECLDFQFKVFSRYQTVRTNEWEMSKGAM